MQMADILSIYCYTMGVDPWVDRGTCPPYFLKWRGRHVFCPLYFFGSRQLFVMDSTDYIHHSLLLLTTRFGFVTHCIKQQNYFSPFHFFADLRPCVSKKVLKNVVINCLLILQPCSVEIFALNVQSFIISQVLK